MWGLYLEQIFEEKNCWSLQHVCDICGSYNLLFSELMKQRRRSIFSLHAWRIVPEHSAKSPPVYAGLGVSDLVETGDFEAEGVSSLALVHEVAKGQHHLQDLSQPFASDHLLGPVQDGWKENGKRKKQLERSYSWWLIFVHSVYHLLYYIIKCFSPPIPFHSVSLLSPTDTHTHAHSSFSWPKGSHPLLHF